MCTLFNHYKIIKICKITTQETTQRDKKNHELDFKVIFFSRSIYLETEELFTEK